MLRTGPRTALVVSGGGARAAYEAGVLKAIRELLPEPQRNPFPLLCGVSCGAINAAGLAVTAEDFASGVDTLEAFWSGLRAGDVYRADPLGVALSGGRWLAALAAGWAIGVSPRSLLDATPLARRLSRDLHFDQLERAIASHALHALSITCSGYASGECVTFFQARADQEPWQRSQRVGAHVTLGVHHVMASLAVPFLFPAVKLHREFFGDGTMRELTPLSPAVQLGAERILVIGTGRMASRQGDRPAGHRYPTLAEAAGHVLSGIYVDSLSADLERLTQVNRLLEAIPPAQQAATGLRPIRVLVIEPSERLDFLAARHWQQLPVAVRALLRGMGVSEAGGGAFASYLLFESAYTRALIGLGYRDALARREEIAAFLLG
jgi:NTE family protein